MQPRTKQHPLITELFNQINEEKLNDTDRLNNIKTVVNAILAIQKARSKETSDAYELLRQVGKLKYSSYETPVEALLDFNAVDDNGLTIGEIACKNNQIELVKYFLTNMFAIPIKPNMLEMKNECSKIILEALSHNLLVTSKTLTEYPGYTQPLNNLISMLKLCLELRTGLSNTQIKEKLSGILTEVLNKHWTNTMTDCIQDTLLHLAVYHKNIDNLFELLMQSGMDLDSANQKKQTPLHLAIVSEHNKKNYYTTQLIESGRVDVNKITSEGNSPLILAITRCNPSIISLLIEKKAKVNYQDKKSNTALHYAVECFTENPTWYLQIIALLLKAGADMNIKNTSGISALENAFKSDNQNLLTLFIKYQSHLNTTFMAIEKDNQTALSCLSEAKVNFNDISHHSGHTPLTYAIYMKKDEVAKQLLRLGADPDLANRYKDTPLYWATYLSKSNDKLHDVVKTLLQFNAQLETANKGSTALDVAVQNDNFTAATHLIRKGAKIRDTEEFKQFVNNIRSIEPDKEFLQTALNTHIKQQQTLTSKQKNANSLFSNTPKQTIQMTEISKKSSLDFKHS